MFYSVHEKASVVQGFLLPGNIFNNYLSQCGAQVGLLANKYQLKSSVGGSSNLMDTSSLLEFSVLLPEDIQLIAPTAYAKLNLLNHCQHLKLFMSLQEDKGVCAHSRVLSEKLEAVREVITKIVETDKILEGSQKFV